MSSSVQLFVDFNKNQVEPLLDLSELDEMFPFCLHRTASPWLNLANESKIITMDLTMFDSRPNMSDMFILRDKVFDFFLGGVSWTYICVYVY